jgi:hypothetical protein
MNTHAHLHMSLPFLTVSASGKVLADTKVAIPSCLNVSTQGTETSVRNCNMKPQFFNAVSMVTRKFVPCEDDRKIADRKMKNSRARCQLVVSFCPNLLVHANRVGTFKSQI